MKYYNYDIVFQEVPDEVSLAINITGCPNHCKGCHSPHLWEDTGKLLDEDALDRIIGRYGNLITCVCLMGGDADPEEVVRLLRHVRTHTDLKTAWYSGRELLPDIMGANAKISLQDIFYYIKLGPYIPEKGGLKSKTTNQRIYRIEGDEMIDITDRMQMR